MSPTQRSLKLLRDDGYMVANVEKWNPHARIRQDAFGFIDLLAIRGDETVAVQTTSGANVAARISKMRLIPAADHWMGSPTRKLLIHGWSKRGPRGKAKHWVCRTIEITQTGTKELCEPLR